MIKRKVRLIVRKLWKSDHFLSDEEISMYHYLDLARNIGEVEPVLNLKKKDLLAHSISWLDILQSLEKKRRIKDLHVYRTKVSLVLILKPPKFYPEEKKYTYG